MSFNFNITNKCNRRCKFCFEGDWFKRRGPLLMRIEDIETILSREADTIRAHIRRIGILGGEPTSHPQFKEIVTLIKQYVPDVFVMTNGIMDEETATFLTGHMHMLNLDGPHLGEQETMFRNTIRIWDAPNLPPYGTSVTIDDPDKDFTFLLDTLRETRNLKHIRIGITSPGYEFANEVLLDAKPNFAYGEAYLRLVKAVREVRPDAQFYNECCVNDYVMSDEVLRELARYHVEGLKKTCTFPNFDIYPDLSMTWCFPFADIPEMSIANVLDYPTLQAALNALGAKFKAMCIKLGFNPMQNTSGCLAAQYYRKVVLPQRAADDT